MKTDGFLASVSAELVVRSKYANSKQDLAKKSEVDVSQMAVGVVRMESAVNIGERLLRSVLGPVSIDPGQINVLAYGSEFDGTGSESIADARRMQKHSSRLTSGKWRAMTQELLYASHLD